MTKKATEQMLSLLDEEYGTTKEGFLHFKDWQLLLAIMLSAQSTDKQVEQALPGLWERYQQIEQLAEAKEEEIESYIRGIGLYKSKAKNMKKCCGQLLADFEGKVPMTIPELVTLAGVGRKSATLFLADAYGIPGVTVDTHVLRVARRIGWAKAKTPVAVEKELMEVIPEEHWNRLNFQLIYHGRAVCTARKAYCERCLLEPWCEQNLEE